MNDELSRKIMKQFLGWKAKTYSYLKDNKAKWQNDNDKKAKGTKECVIKRKIKFQNYKNCSEASQVEKKINDLGKN